MSCRTEILGGLSQGAISLAGASMLLLSFMGPAVGADTSFNAKLNQRFAYNDNIGLSSTALEESASSVTTPEFRLSINTPSSRTSFDGRLDVGRFSNDSRYNYEDQTANFSTAYFGRRSEVGVGARVRHLSTLESEQTDTGLVDVFGRKLDISGSPYFSYRVTQRGTLRGGGFAGFADYYDTAALEDYRYYGANIGYSYQLSQIDSLGTRFEYRHFENEDSPGNESDTYSGSLVWSRDITDRLVSEFAVGPRYTEQTTTEGLLTEEDETWGVALSGDLDWQATELARLRFGLSRSVEPSGIGTTSERDTARFNGTYRVTQLIRLGLQSYYQRDNRVGELGQLDRDYFTVSPSLNWEISRNWELSTGYRYRWQQYEGSDSATSNMVFISLSLKTTGWNVAPPYPAE